ncbi:MAG TPA: NAD(P)-dependent oxidoreductase [Nitriliruptorales bacterium]|nr:NAD(P)-dependent oxidoreductase [Nitriliruptorales bacterium]
MGDDRQTTALVTGGTGFVGGHMVRALQDQGRPVRTCGRRPRPDDLPEGVDYRTVDLTSDESLDELFEGVGDVFHFAGASSSTSTPEQMERVNVTGTERLLQAAYESGVGRVVHVSTSSVYGKEVSLPEPVPEDAECHPSPGYAETKWQAEQVAWGFADKGLPVVVLRPVTVYGPGAIKLVASTILDAAIERFAGLDAFAVPSEPVELRLVHVDDVVAACSHLAASDEAVGRAFNLAAGVYPSSHVVAEPLADEVGIALELTDDPDAGLSYERRAEERDKMLAAGMTEGILLKEERIRFLKKANPNNRLSLDALESTGFRPQVTDIPANVRASVRWYREQRWII